MVGATVGFLVAASLMAAPATAHPRREARPRRGAGGGRGAPEVALLIYSRTRQGIPWWRAVTHFRCAFRHSDAPDDRRRRVGAAIALW
jgi:hypothetical protein